MGYACPVCDTPQRDGEHLAHHLAFTAMLHGDDHEAWLDERVPDWSERDPAGLAAAVAPHADEAEYQEVFEDTVPRGRPDVGMGSGAHADGHGAGHDHSGHDRSDHDRGASHRHVADASPASGVPDPDAVDDPAVAEALREARELTRDADEGADHEDDSPSGESDPAGESDPEREEVESDTDPDP